MVEAGCICDRCGHEHGTPGDNRAFRWCRRIKGTICKYQERLRTARNPRTQTKEILMEIIKTKERDIETREKEYERLHARDGQPREMF